MGQQSYFNSAVMALVFLKKDVIGQQYHAYVCCNNVTHSQRLKMAINTSKCLWGFVTFTIIRKLLDSTFNTFPVLIHWGNIQTFYVNTSVGTTICQRTTASWNPIRHQ